MMKKTFKTRLRTGGFRRKISKEKAKIMISSITAEKDNLSEVSGSDINEGSVGHLNNKKHMSEASCSHSTAYGTLSHQNKKMTEVSPNNNDEGSVGLQNHQADVESLSIRPESSDESDSESNFNKYENCLSFRENIRRWAIHRNINQIALKDLAKIMNELIPEILPVDPRTILKTPRFVSIKKIEGGGEYWHNGITNNLTSLLENWTDVPENISLNLNFDGLPIFKSSKKEFWPILCNISENPNIKPLVVGIYYGTGKPKDLSAYLEDFVTEVSRVLEEGITLQNSEKKVTVKIRCFICDSPARAFIKGVCNFNGKHGCMKCVTVGEYSHNSHTVTFPDTSCSERTNEGFRNKLYGAHHKHDSPLLNLPIDMVKDFPVGDSLHLIDLGIMKRFLVGWRDGNFGKFLTKWRAKDIEIVNNFLNKCKLPSEIHRAVRGLEYLAFWKGSEYRTFLFYLSIIILPDVVTSAVFSHFLKLYCAITICSAENHMRLLPLAKELLKDFVKQYKDFYGADYVTSNVHNLIHVTAEVERFGPLYSFSAYPFENELYCIKRLLRDGKNPLSQIANRIVEATTEFSGPKNPELCEKPNYPFLTARRNNLKELHLLQFKVSSKIKDRYVLTTINDIVEISNIVQETNEIRITGVKISNIEDVFTYPIKSSHLNIYKVKYNDDSNCDIVLGPRDLQCKLVCLHHNEYLYFIPLLHTYK